MGDTRIKNCITGFMTYAVILLLDIEKARIMKTISNIYQKWRMRSMMEVCSIINLNFFQPSLQRKLQSTFSYYRSFWKNISASIFFRAYISFLSSFNIDVSFALYIKQFLPFVNVILNFGDDDLFQFILIQILQNFSLFHKLFDIGNNNGT